MAEYIKREMPDMNGTGERKVYYKVKTYSNLSSEDFVKKICYPGSGLKQGDVAKVMCRMVDEMKRWLAEGHTISIDELGTFSLSIGVMDDEEVEDFDGNGKKVTAKRIGVRGVNFRPDKQLVRDIARKCKLYKGYDSPNNRSPYTRDQRLKMAQDYIAEHHFMRVRDYELMTLLPHSTAAKELRDFCIQPTGITSEGRGKEGMDVAFDTVMGGRVGYYPGSGFDGNLVAVANKAHCVHSFLYVDYLVKKEELENMMDKGSFRGYHSIGRIEWSELDIMPNGSFPITVNYTPRMSPMHFVDKTIEPYCFTEVLERNADKDDEWGAERFSITFLFADGIATYFQLFVKQFVKAPWLFLLQDHGFGCNYDRFGKNGFLDAIIRESNIRPEFVICATNTHIWDGYSHVEGTKETYGGMHQHERFLYKRD